MIEELLTHWNAADPATRRAGRRWYVEAEREAVELSRAGLPGVGRVAAAGILAALSPRAQWSVNVRSAWAIVTSAAYACAFALPEHWGDPPAVGLPDCRDKAWRIARGERPGEVLSGRKVRAFWRAIAGDRDAAVVDVWMCRAMGIELRTISPAQYERCAEALREAARRVRVPVRDFQATIWLQVRGAKPTDGDAFRPVPVRG